MNIRNDSVKNTQILFLHPTFCIC